MKDIKEENKKAYWQI